MDSVAQEPVADSFFNPCERWHAIVAAFEPTIQAIAVKVSRLDHVLREDCAQEMRIALLQQHPERIRGYDVERDGILTPTSIPGPVKRFMANTARNAALSMMQSHNLGCWYVGRSYTRYNKKDGTKKRIHRGARYRSLPDLHDAGFDIDDTGRIVSAHDDDASLDGQ